MTTAKELIYCVKCRTKTVTRDLEPFTLKNGKPAVRGVCVDCGYKKHRFGPMESADASRFPGNGGEATANG